MTHRYFRQTLPAVEDYVMYETVRSADHCLYVKLLQYNNLEAMMLLTEISKRTRNFSLVNRLKSGVIDVGIVIRVDKGYIDISRRRVTNEDAEKCRTIYNYQQLAHRILSAVSSITGHSLDDLYNEIWRFEDEHKISLFQPHSRPLEGGYGGCAPNMKPL